MKQTNKRTQTKTDGQESVEKARPKNDGQKAGLENAGIENDGLKFDRLENTGLKFNRLEVLVHYHTVASSFSKSLRGLSNPWGLSLHNVGLLFLQQ